MSQHSSYMDDPLLAEFYDYVPRYAARPDREFYLEEARAASGPILELGCGTGRILIPIAESGCAITGVDSSPYMLDRCRRKLQSLNGDTRERPV